MYYLSFYMSYSYFFPQQLFLSSFYQYCELFNFPIYQILMTFFLLNLLASTAITNFQSKLKMIKKSLVESWVDKIVIVIAIPFFFYFIVGLSGSHVPKQPSLIAVHAIGRKRDWQTQFILFNGSHFSRWWH